MFIKDYIVLEGNTNDLLLVNGDSSLKCTRLIKLDENVKDEYTEEIIDLAITSTSMKKEHTLFDKLLNHKIKISVDIIE